MRRLLGAALCGGLFFLLYGCGVLKIEMVQPANVVEWQNAITQSVNTHTRQICELQKKVFGVCTIEQGDSPP